MSFLYCTLLALAILTPSLADAQLEPDSETCDDPLQFENMGWGNYLYYSLYPTSLCQHNFGDSCIKCSADECLYRNTFWDNNGCEIPCGNKFPGCIACTEEACLACDPGGYISGYTRINGECFDCRHFGYDCLTCNIQGCTHRISDDYGNF